jgi:hypothetical protein
VVFEVGDCYLLSEFWLKKSGPIWYHEDLSAREGSSLYAGYAVMSSVVKERGMVLQLVLGKKISKYKYMISRNSIST